MAYNNGRENRKWLIWKEAEEKILREHGVDETTTPQIRTDDRADFNSNRRFYHWTSNFGEYLDFSGSHWKMKLPQYRHFTRLDTLDERLTPDFIRSCLGGASRYGNYKARISYSPHMPEQYKNAWKPHQKTTGILALYYYCVYTSRMIHYKFVAPHFTRLRHTVLYLHRYTPV